MKREVIKARLHDIKYVVEGIGQLDVVLPPANKTYPGLQMFWDGEILEITIKGQTYGVPGANIQVMTFAAAPPAPKAVEKAKSA